MANDEMLTDEYVANLLVEEAREGFSGHSGTGMDAFPQSKKPANKPKPNTHFLRKIIRSTDHHNRALLAKGTAESNAKLKGLERAEEVKRLKNNPNPSDIRRRQMGDIHAILGGTKRTRRGEGGGGDGGRASRSRDKDEKLRQPRDEESSKQANDLSQDDRHHRKRHGDKEERRSSRRARDHGGHGGHCQSRRHARSRSPREEKQKHRQRSRRRSRHRSCSKDAPAFSGQAADGKQGSDSDSSSDAIGPAPPPARYRGRGRIGGAASLDRRFSESYDPNTDDVDMDLCDADDAGNAEETSKDLLKLLQIQEERMKRAGFTEDEIRKSKYGTDKTEREVVWSKAGEKREWDQGKVVDEDEGEGEGEGEPSTLLSERF